MHLYLIRHAQAVDAEVDPERPLSDRGRAQVRTLADFLRRSAVLQTKEIWHSPLARARETAHLLARHLKLDARVREMPDLLPEDEPAALARRLTARHNPVAVVGHNPHLSALAALLVTGSVERPAFALKKCSALALDRTDAGWLVRWHVTPELLA